MKAWSHTVICCAFITLVTGCANHPPAPVDDRSQTTTRPAANLSSSPAAENRAGFYTVKKGDTLFSIALDNGQNYRDIAAWNNLENPNLIKVGQSLRVAADENTAVVVKPIRTTDTVEAKPVAANTAGVKNEPRGGKQAYTEEAWAAAQRNAANTAPTAAPVAQTISPPTAPAPEKAPAPAPPPPPVENVNDWAWPISGKVSSGFADGSNKGIDIPAKAGQSVLAANNGTVTLVSNALRGYGNLVVIKHSQTLLSVYAHNSKILVTEGQAVTKGQKIAEVGTSDSETPKLHFEIRNMGKPVDPLKYLPSR